MEHTIHTQRIFRVFTSIRSSYLILIIFMVRNRKGYGNNSSSQVRCFLGVFRGGFLSEKMRETKEMKLS